MHHAAAGPLWAFFTLLGALASACGGQGKNAAPVPPPPDVVIITIDTLRADRVGGALTPSINAVGAKGARFLAARTTVPLTLPAHVSLMTGALPPQTGVRLNGAHRFDAGPVAKMEAFVQGTNLLDQTIRYRTSTLKDIAPAGARAVVVGLRGTF